MRATDSMICWTPVDACDNPTRGRMALVPWPDTAGRSDEFAFTALACDAAEALERKQRSMAEGHSNQPGEPHAVGPAHTGKVWGMIDL